MTSRRRAGLWDIQPGSFGLIVGVLLMANSVRAGEAVNRPTPLDQADFHVALNGKDTNPGTAAAPFATLPRARDAVREKRKLGQDRDILVAIHGGRYCLTEPLVFGPEDSGTDEHSITYAAGQGEEVVLSGGRAIAGWKKADAGPLWTVELPEVKAGRWYFRQLFVNGRRAVRARTPNADDKVPWWKIKTSTFKGQDASPIVLSVDHRIPAWKNAADVELVYVRNNDGSRKRLGAVDEAAQTFTLPPPHEWYPKILPGDFRVDQPTPGLSCYLENALEMLDEPGEWYLDRATGVLSYWPRPGEDLKEAEAIAPVVQTTLLAVAGARQNPVRNLRFRGIRVEHVDWPLPPQGFAGLFGCKRLLSDRGNPPISDTWIDAAVSFLHARSCDFTDGGVAHAGGMGICLLNGCTRNVIEGNRVFDLGGGGIAAGAVQLNRDTWKWAEPVEADDHAGYRIANNYIHHCGLDYFGAIGIFLAASHEAVVSHNLIHDIGYAGIAIFGNETPREFAKDNTVAYNHIFSVMKMTNDGGGFYITFSQGGRGADIRGNLVHTLRQNNSFCSSPWGNNGIFLDAVRPQFGCRNYHIEGNVIYDIQAEPVRFCQCTRDQMTWKDNVFERPSKEALDAIEATAGLEPRYRAAIPQNSP